MKITFASIVLFALFLLNSVQAQPGKSRGKKPADFSRGAANGPINGGQAKFDSLNMHQSKNEVAIETTERKKANSGVKLDDLKNPFDTGKVRTPAVNRTGKQRSKQNNR
jgi:hypothetical protein